MWASLKSAYAQVRKPRLFINVCLIGLVLSAVFPTDLQSYRPARPDSELRLAIFTDHYLHFANTIVQVALPILLRDKIGLIQDVYVGISTTLATHGLKYLVDNRKVWGTRLGERPLGPDTRYNMPSGHSSQASCGAYFVWRRYGWMHSLYLIPILLLTMYSRVALNAHTVSAVIAGALIGLLTAAIFTSDRTAPTA